MKDFLKDMFISSCITFFLILSYNIFIIKYDVEKIQETLNKNKYDINNDKEVDIRDLVVLQKYILNKE